MKTNHTAPRRGLKRLFAILLTLLLTAGLAPAGAGATEKQENRPLAFLLRLLSVLLVLTVFLSVCPLPNVSAADGVRPTIHFAVDDPTKAESYLIIYSGGSGTAGLSGAGANLASVQTSNDDFQIRFAPKKANNNYANLLGFTVTVNGVTSERITPQMVESVGETSTAVPIGDFSTSSNQKVYYRLMGGNDAGQIRINYKNTVNDPDITITWCYLPERNSDFAITKGTSDNGTFDITTTNDENTYKLTATPNADYAFDHWTYTTDENSEPQDGGTANPLTVSRQDNIRSCQTNNWRPY
ncbi:MAG: hypothetical protein LBN12_03040 [Clostridiales Family XIII bacterium]|jgi:hypothetical protein|nr:hypothetical protein [Clostridiales Family XIII bacterium]